MQTFLPFPDFAQSARALDRARLGKQRVEAKQILKALLGESKGWANHPAVRMWKGHHHWLALYGKTVCEVWRSRGYKDSLLDYFAGFLGTIPAFPIQPSPPWMGNSGFHRSHQSNLIRKLPAHYGPLFPGVPDTLPYVWPGAHT